MIRTLKTMRCAVAAFAAMAFCRLQAMSWQLDIDESSLYGERIEATQNGGESDTYTIKVPSGYKAHVRMYISDVTSTNIGGRRIYVQWNGGSEEYLDGKGASNSRTFSSDGTARIGVRCSAGTHEVPHQRVIYIGGRPIYSTYYTTEEYRYYQCAVTYDISVSYEALKPDLTVSELSLSETEAPVDEEITISYTIKNAGGKPAGASVAHVYDGENQIGRLEVLSLEGGEGQSGALVVANLEPGDHAIKVVADVDGAVDESNEMNND